MWERAGSRQEEEVARAAAVVWARVRPRHLLYVDDDRCLLDRAARDLEEIGARCVMATTHAHAVEALAEDACIGAAILDFSMPDGDVGELARRLRNLRPDVVLVGTGALDQRRAFRSRGVDRFLAKPWRPEALPRAVGW